MESVKYTPEYCSGFMEAMDRLLIHLNATDAEYTNAEELKKSLYHWGLKQRAYDK